MKKPSFHKDSLILTAIALSILTTSPAFAGQEAKRAVAPAVQERPTFAPFTGKVSSNRVRLRTAPDLNSTIIRELKSGDHLAVVKETDEFYAVTPPKDIRTYIFRTYVLDNIVEGANVNVRLQPMLDSPVVTQLNTGDFIEGRVSAKNSKWLEINPPDSVVFYISKDYVERAGDIHFLAQMEKRKSEVKELLNNAYLQGQVELRKPFNEVDVSGAVSDLEQLIASYQDFPEDIKQAQKALELIQDAYLEKKVVFLESRAQKSVAAWEQKNNELERKLSSYQAQLAELEQQLQEGPADFSADQPTLQTIEVREISVHNTSETSKERIAEAVIPTTPVTSPKANRFSDTNNKAAKWEPVEEAIYLEWANNHAGKNRADFYLEQRINAEEVIGVLEHYTKPIRNRPGDYVIKKNGLPVAYLYSTKVSLEDKVGKVVSVQGAERPNNNFAFPAYHALSVVIVEETLVPAVH
ncbi:SH3 domain-containing protein [Simkania negevensis]|uniref:SH3 domain-containing protein n=1 Tax=Simkania negevensis TaxID=83561 RepID=A0ABS3AR64_9BACT|nr:SH3 domain-containing protein [Simkania negevensis]